MKRVCGWCGLVLEDGDPPISHGICGKCEADLLATLEEGPPTLVEEKPWLTQPGEYWKSRRG